MRRAGDGLAHGRLAQGQLGAERIIDRQPPDRNAGIRETAVAGRIGFGQHDECLGVQRNLGAHLGVVFAVVGHRPRRLWTTAYDPMSL